MEQLEGEIGDEIRVRVQSQGSVKESRFNLADEKFSNFYILRGKEIAWDNLLGILTYQSQFNDKGGEFKHLV